MAGQDITNTSEKTSVCFFLSYARDDGCTYLNRFYKDLSEAVAEKAATEPDETSYRDQEAIPAGQDWSVDLAQALQTSHCMVALFSPRYFKRVMCGKEFQVFLDRQDEVVLEDGVAVNSRYILPVLWLKWKDLERQGLPPKIAEKIQLAGGEHSDVCREYGIKGILRKKTAQSGVYKDIIEDLADRIMDLVQDPLPPMGDYPSLDQAQSAFHEPVLEVQSKKTPNQVGVFYKAPVVVFMLEEQSPQAFVDTLELDRPVVVLSGDAISTFNDNLKEKETSWNSTLLIGPVTQDNKEKAFKAFNRVLNKGWSGGILLFTNDQSISIEFAQLSDNSATDLLVRHCRQSALKTQIKSMLLKLEYDAVYQQPLPAVFLGEGPTELPSLVGPAGNLHLNEDDSDRQEE